MDFVQKQCPSKLGAMSDLKASPSSAAGVPIGKLARSLPAMVAKHLTEAILSGAIAPGARLTEIALAEEHSVSRTTVREALALVEKARLVERIPRYGAQVVGVKTEEIEEIAQIRGVLLGLAIQRAIGYDDAAELAEFRKLIQGMATMANRDGTTPEEFADCALQAQRKLLAMARSRWLTESYEQLTNLSLWNSLIRTSGSSFVTAKRRQESARNWRHLVEAMEKKDAAQGDAAARALLADVARFMTRLLKKSN